MKKIFLALILISSFCFSQDSLPIQKTKFSVIELEKVKVVYRGIYNPIAIAVSKNVKTFTVSGEGVSATDEIGKYKVRPGGGKELTIIVEMVLLDNSTVVEKHVYEIRPFSAPTSTLNNFYNYRGEILKFNMDELKDAIVGVTFNTCYNVKAEVTQFTIKIPGKQEIIVSENTFTNEILDLLKKCKKKDEIIIFDIKCKYIGIEGLMKNPSPIVFKIIEKEKIEIN